jgi:hypothetical protein
MTFGSLGERTPGAKLLIAAVIIIPCVFILASTINSPDAKAACDIAAAEWEVSNANGEANRPSGVAHFAKQYNVFRQAKSLWTKVRFRQTSKPATSPKKTNFETTRRRRVFFCLSIMLQAALSENSTISAACETFYVSLPSKSL